MRTPYQLAAICDDERILLFIGGPSGSAERRLEHAEIDPGPDLRGARVLFSIECPASQVRPLARQLNACLGVAYHGWFRWLDGELREWKVGELSEHLQCDKSLLHWLAHTGKPDSEGGIVFRGRTVIELSS